MIRQSAATWLLPAVLSLLGCAGLPSAFASDALDSLQARVIGVGERVTPSVVHIEAVVKVNNRRNMVTGSGFFLDENGTVLTNEHVVDRAQKISVIVPGRPGRYNAEVIGTDKQTDLAVLSLETEPGDEPFPVAQLGDSDGVQVGEWVIAIGNPYGLDGTVSLGIVSAKGRDLNAVNLLNDFIQTDAMIDRGSSGGPLVDLRGKVIGINSRGQGRGIGFTIPINTAKQVAADLTERGRIARSYLGVSLQPFDRELARYWNIPDVEGVVVTGVVDPSPADEAGVEVGDILTHFEGEALRAEKDEDVGRFQRLVALAPVGDEIELSLIRKHEPMTLVVRLGAQPKVVPDEEDTDFGFIVQEVTEKTFRSQRLSSRDGVFISFVERGSEAAEAGMAPGDLVQRVDDRNVTDIESFREAMSGIEAGVPFLVRARRGPDTRFLLVVPRGKSPVESANRPGTTGD